jgi:hypothetical protein
MKGVCSMGLAVISGLLPLIGSMMPRRARAMRSPRRSIAFSSAGDCAAARPN